MAKLDQYRQYVQEVIRRHGCHQPAYGEVALQLVFDTERDDLQFTKPRMEKGVL